MLLIEWLVVELLKEDQLEDRVDLLEALGVLLRVQEDMLEALGVLLRA